MSEKKEINFLGYLALFSLLIIVIGFLIGPTNGVFAESDPYSNFSLPLEIICIIGLILLIRAISNEVKIKGSTAKNYLTISIVISILFGVISLVLDNIQISPLPWYTNMAEHTIVAKPDMFYYINEYFIKNFFEASLIFSVFLGVVVYKERIERLIGRKLPFEDAILMIDDWFAKGATGFKRKSEIEEKDHQKVVAGIDKEIRELRPKPQRTQSERFLETEKRREELSKIIQGRIERARTEGKSQEEIDLICARGQQELEKIK